MSSTTITIHRQDANDTEREQMYDDYIQEIADVENRLIDLDSQLTTLNNTLDGMFIRRLVKTLLHLECLFAYDEDMFSVLEILIFEFRDMNFSSRNSDVDNGCNR